jgi:hypothetical protein
LSDSSMSSLFSQSPHDVARAYPLARIAAGRATMPATKTYEQALAENDVDAAYVILAMAKVGRRAMFLREAAAARSADEGTQKLAGLIERHSQWMAG